MTLEISPPEQLSERLSDWLEFLPDHHLGVRIGKVEMGQGLLAAMRQITAEEFDLRLDQVRVWVGDTEHGPDEGLTVGSLSIETCGTALRHICAEVRADLIAVAARRLGLAPGALEVEEGVFLCDGAPTRFDYWTVAADLDLHRPPRGGVTPKPPGAYRLVGRPAPRPDLPVKLAGGGFVHDLHFPGLRHARVLRPPRQGARLIDLDATAIQAAAGEPVTLIQDGEFLAILADQESAADRALLAAEGAATWQGGLLLPGDAGDAAGLPDLVANPAPSTSPPLTGACVHRAVFTRPYLSHATLGPACAVAQWLGGRLTVWAATQGAFPLRERLARATGLAARAIIVRPTPGAGCYGDNGADDAAFDAALIALRAPGRPVRVLWRRADDFGHEPLGPAMRIALEAELDAAGRPLSWRNETWSGPHLDRGRFLAETALEATPPAPPHHAEFTGANGGLRNAMPPYAIAEAVTLHHRAQPPVRTSALRSLGAMAQVFATESFIDELAGAAKADPLAYRLALLNDAVAQRTLAAAAQMADWEARGTRGLGLAYARYKGTGAHVAIAAEVEADERIRLTRLWCAVDAGLIVNPDGARQQIEGGALMAASWVLKEAVRFDADGVSSRSWRDYPILRFSEIPPVEVRFITDAGAPPAGLGEAALGPAAAAVANAASRALGVRLRDLPLSRDALVARLAAA